MPWENYFAAKLLDHDLTHTPVERSLFVGQQLIRDTLLLIPIFSEFIGHPQF